MKKIIGIIAAVIIVVVAAVLIFTVFMRGPDVSEFEFLRDPRITTINDRKVIEVVVSGDPQKNLPGAFSLLYSAYYQIPIAQKSAPQSAPLLRFNFPPDSSIADLSKQGSLAGSIWHLGLVVPENAALKAPVEKGGLKAEITTWQYGEVAEILHIGPYDREFPTIEKLEAFVKSKGYRFKGVHEEEYLRGPGMLFSNPEKFYTIIRYPVEKVE